MSIISTQNLTKQFGSIIAVDDISLQVNEGEIYGFLGLNGAGKSTLIRILLGMISPNQGKVRLFGQDVLSRFQYWNEIGYLVETPHSYGNLSVYENLRVICKLRQISDDTRIDGIINDLKLTRYRDVKASHLSMGNKQRLGLAKALMHRPKLLILDEPINGLDPAGIVEVRELLKSLAINGSTIFLSSHILEEISKVTHRIGIIHHGQLIKEVTSEQLANERERKLMVKTADQKKAVRLLRNSYNVRLNEEEVIEIKDSYAMQQPEKIAQLLVNENVPPKQVYIYEEDLEHYFLRHIHSS